MSRYRCRVVLEYPTVKLLDYDLRLPELQSSSNPFAVLVAAHLHAQGTTRGSRRRLQQKLSLVRSLYERGLSREDILELFRLVDWILALSAENSRLFEEELARYEEEKKMPYVTSVERIGIKKGLQRGLERGLERGHRKGQQKGGQDLLLAVLESRFQSVPQDVQDGIRALRDPGVLTDLGRQAATVDSMDRFAQDLAAATRRELPPGPAQP